MKSQKKQTHQEEDICDDVVEDVVYETQQGDAVVRRLRERLKTCEQDKHTYLDGWQRLKADVLNTKKRNAERESARTARTRAEILSSLLPVLDSFDMAFTGEAWEHVDKIWRTGVEHIHTQLLDVLASYDYTQYGMIGDIFDPKVHEAIESIDGDGEKQSGTIARIVRHGYRHADVVVRPAQVVTYT